MLSPAQIESIQLNVMLKKKTAEFIKKSAVPVNAYYNAMSGGAIKTKYINSILKTLNKYVSKD